MAPPTQPLVTGLARSGGGAGVLVAVAVAGLALTVASVNELRR